MLQPGKVQYTLTSDAASMMRRRIRPNDPPYIVAIHKHNNKIVDSWKKEILDKVCNTEGKVQSNQIYQDWVCYFTGRYIDKFIDHYTRGLLLRPTEKMVDYWKDFFEHAEIQTMIEMGPTLIQQGWKVIIEENLISKLEDHHEKIYGQSNDPKRWKELYNDHPKLWNEDGKCIFWDPETFNEIQEKVMFVIKYGEPTPE